MSRSNRNTDSFDLASFLPSASKKSAASTKEDALSAFLPKSFGGTSQKSTKEISQDQKKDEKSMIEIKNEIASEAAEAQFEYDDDVLNEPLPPLPITEQIELHKEHEKAITALGCDPSGSRMITGSYDYHIKFWDFNGMDSSYRSFRSVQPWDGYQIKDLQFSKRGEMFLVASTAVYVKLYDRDGLPVKQFANGDPYIRDMKNTRGHIAPISCCQWHPHDHQLFMTAASDSTVRIWDVENHRNQKDVIVTRSTSTGHRLSSSVTAACFTPDGKLIAGAKQDGSISLWNWKMPYLKPQYHLDNAHMTGSETSRIAIASDNFTLVSRGGDDTMKIWDLRMFGRPIKIFSNLDSHYTETDVIFSPNERYIVTGTSAKKGGSGRLLFYDRYTFETKHETEFPDTSIIRLMWHPKLNQVIATGSDASVHAFYDRELSHNGVLLGSGKTFKKRQQEAFTNAEKIYSYYEIEEGLDELGDKKDRRRRKGRQDVTSLQGPQKSTDPGAALSNVLMPTVRRTADGTIIRDTTRDEDPREALLRHAKEAEENPMWIGHVYKNTQPKTIFDETRDELEDQREVKRRK